MFPTITNISQVIDCIKRTSRDKWFTVKDNGITTIVCYNHNTGGAFSPDGISSDDLSMLCELRGITFDSVTGKVLCRKLHKFFNLGEREPRENLDLSKEHSILMKLDGSMIATYVLAGEVVFETKRGVTSVADEAEQFGKKNAQLMQLIIDQYANGWTPIWEYTAPSNQIVIEYDQPALTLIALRNTATGQYMPYGDMVSVANKYGCAVVQPLMVSKDDIGNNLARFTGIEGVVVRFHDGNMIKIKTEEYCTKHRGTTAKNAIDRRLIRAIASLSVDDMSQFASPETLVRINEWSEYINTTVARLVDQYWDIMSATYQDRKSMILVIKAAVPSDICTAMTNSVSMACRYNSPITKDIIANRLMSLIAWRSHSTKALKQMVTVFHEKQPQ